MRHFHRNKRYISSTYKNCIGTNASALFVNIHWIRTNIRMYMYKPIWNAIIHTLFIYNRIFFCNGCHRRIKVIIYLWSNRILRHSIDSNRSNEIKWIIAELLYRTVNLTNKPSNIYSYRNKIFIDIKIYDVKLIWNVKVNSTNSEVNWIRYSLDNCIFDNNLECESNSMR